MTPRAFADVMDRAYTHMRPWTADAISQTIANPHSVFLSRDDGALLALIVADECEILAIATDPAVQRTGIASSLLKELFEIAARRNANRVFLEVALQNSPARKFYAGKGFAQVGLRKKYYTLRDGTKDDAVLLSRAVP